ncbi:hypothetical protein FRZ67_16620 [Panacibacter ginsenosidivorans]|uniref:Uncharacterized protein n=1 Tax=Panacibacter ginsenosidivorans TaxID=1813871 RepID=A0A5B8VBH8_9BACT|nr:hypothetical protein [Panacibacter ginsenosidivorans]QEC68850.1 hypothetical protein FRZ67_16620 [Panacibacter ginsenosidivorans]
MIKIGAILLLTLHLCSSVFYTFIFKYFISLSDKDAVSQIDKAAYKDAELVEIAIPLNMPYMQSQNDYERYDGSIEFNGTHYNYVKRKTTNDTLHLLCLPNAQKTQLYATKNDYAKQLSDAPSSKKGSESSAIKSTFFSEYSYQSMQYDLTCFHIRINQHITIMNPFLASCFIETAGKPPQSLV